MMSMTPLFQIRETVSLKFNLCNCADATCTIMQRYVAQFKSSKKSVF